MGRSRVVLANGADVTRVSELFGAPGRAGGERARPSLHLTRRSQACRRRSQNRAPTDTYGLTQLGVRVPSTAPSRKSGKTLAERTNPRFSDRGFLRFWVRDQRARKTLGARRSGNASAKKLARRPVRAAPPPARRLSRLPAGVCSDRIRRASPRHARSSSSGQSALPIHQDLRELRLPLSVEPERQKLGPHLGLRLVSEVRNLILSCPPGRGNTRLPVAIGYRSIQNGFFAKFVDASALVDELGEASRAGLLREANGSLGRATYASAASRASCRTCCSWS
jgi:hypothetical protein